MCVVSQSIMVRWQPPPSGSLNGELMGYKLRYRKGLRRADSVEITTTQLSQIIDGTQTRATQLCVLDMIRDSLTHVMLFQVWREGKFTPSEFQPLQ